MTEKKKGKNRMAETINGEKRWLVRRRPEKRKGMIVIGERAIVIAQPKIKRKPEVHRLIYFCH